MLSIADRHVLKQIAMPLLASMGIGLLMLLADRMVRLLDTALGKKNSFGVVFEMMAYLVPHYLGTAIPAALMLGLMFGFGRMSANSETDAFQASGIGLHRLTRPVIILSVVLALVELAVSGWAQPYARYAYRSVVFNIVNVEVFYLAEEGVFMQSGERTFILDTLNRSSNSFDHVFIYDDKGAEGSNTITASRGRLMDVPGQPRPVLKLEDGHQMTFKTQPDPLAVKPPLPEVTEFTTATAPLGKISKDVFRPRGQDQRELTLPELLQQRTTPPPGSRVSAMTAEINQRIIDAVGMLVLPFLALPFAVSGRRQHRGYRFGFALVLVIVVHETIAQGANAAHDGASPLLTMWLPLALLAIFAGWSYYLACFTVTRDPINHLVDSFGDMINSLRARLTNRLGITEPGE